MNADFNSKNQINLTYVLKSYQNLILIKNEQKIK